MKTASFLFSAKIVGCLFAVAVAALPQAYTISAKPGAVNYVEGDVTLDGQPVAGYSLKSTFLNAGGLLETADGKAEVLLTPGVFLRVGDHSRVRMLKPSLIDTQLAVEAGESMLEVDQFVKESRLTISMRGGMTEIQKIGLYRFMADGAPSVGVIDGKAEVAFGDRHKGLSKGHEVLLNDSLKAESIDKDRADELFAWSNIRSQYNASLTYQAARTAVSSGYDANYGGYGGYAGQGWFWNSGFNSWLWMPGSAFYSPFGWGFYGPGYVLGAPVVYIPVRGGGGFGGPTLAGAPGGIKPIKPPIRPRPTEATPTTPSQAGMTVPVNAKHMPAVGFNPTSQSSFEAARMQSSRAISANGGLRTTTGDPVSRSTGFGGGNNGRGYNGGGNNGARNAGGGGNSSPRTSMSAGGGGNRGGGGMSGGGMSGGGGGARPSATPSGGGARNK